MVEQGERSGAVGAALRAAGRAHAFRAGERLHEAGRPTPTVLLVEQGWIVRMRANCDGRLSLTGIHIAGEVVGADALVTGRLDDDLVALTDGSAMIASASSLRDAVERDGAMARSLAGLLAAETVFLREALAAVGTQSCGERLCALVLQTWRRLVAAGLVAPDVRAFELPLTQVQLGAAVGATPVHLSRSLRRLREAGVLDLHRGTVRIGDPATLERAAQAAGDAASA